MDNWCGAVGLMHLSDNGLLPPFQTGSGLTPDEIEKAWQAKISLLMKETKLSPIALKVWALKARTSLN